MSEEKVDLQAMKKTILAGLKETVLENPNSFATVSVHPKANCRKCYGRGHVGTLKVVGKPDQRLFCPKCVLPTACAMGRKNGFKNVNVELLEAEKGKYGR